jgi:integrase/recombinase XerD
MNTWPDIDRKIIARYLGRLRLRCPISPICYRQALRSFQDVVVRQQYPCTQVNRKILEIWLSECTAIWARSTLMHHARIVNRFLDFLVEEALIVSNPIADLRAEYHAKSDKAIVRALLAPDPDQALEARYGSSRRSVVFSATSCAAMSR